ncbi:hypothetical protein [Nakamurella deserti]|uniref:hypothetical protein n=1 Tax=Nakamurella deserti TaxID=2164074 RepID=UPI000DBEAA94|nr:hypothetical protein [Nakamurella deserti]
MRRRTRGITGLLAAVLLGACGTTADTGTAASIGSATPAPAGTPGTTPVAANAADVSPAPASAAPATAGPAEAATSGTATAPLTVPVTTVDDANGLPRVVVEISVGGGAPVPVILDTGSSGLMIDASVLGSDVDTSGAVPFTKNYVSSSIQGSVVQAPVSIGGVSTPAIGVVAYQSSQGANDQLTGGIAKGLIGIASEGQTGTAAPVWSPSLQLPAPYDTMSTLEVATSDAGTWTLGPVPSAADAVTVALTAVTGAPDNAGRWGKDMNLCWTFAGGSPACGATDLDTGAQDLLVNSDVAGVSPAAGQAVTVAASQGGTPLWTTTTGQALTGVHQASLGTTQFNTGLSFFFDHLVTFDYGQGRVLLSPR